MYTLRASPFRSHLEQVLDSASSELFVASPYIKTSEAEWVCERICKRNDANAFHVRVMTDVRSANVLSGSLDMAALRVFKNSFSHCEVINLPRLHAKVYVADESNALITSANLTPSGLDNNLEYGIAVSEKTVIQAVRRDLQRYAELGNQLTTETISDLEQVADGLRQEFQIIERSTEKKLRRKFNETLKRANTQFLRAQVGTRSAHGLFADAIMFLLSSRPMTTVELHARIKELFPELCDDTVDLVINGQHFGKKWKHVVRSAQAFLRRKGAIRLVGDEWHGNL